MKITWEVIHEKIFERHHGSFGERTSRAKVFGGWLIKNETWDYTNENNPVLSESMAFISDDFHKWKEGFYGYI